jgi:ER membrane protein complex subunit 2
MTMTDADSPDLPTLIARNDHWHVLRFIRIHALREPQLVVHHGKLLLGGGDQLDKKTIRGGGDNLARLAALEQICLAALDLADSDSSQNGLLAKTCLDRLQESSDIAPDDSVRFRLLVARCLEAAQDYSGAEQIYQDLLKENPANLVALKRLYCVARAVATDEKSLEVACGTLQTYLEFNYSDTAAWYELALLRQEMGDFPRAAFCLEEVLLAVPSDAALHVALAECYATLATTCTTSTSSSSTTTTTTTTSSLSDLEYCILARKHFAQALELDGPNKNNRRALFGLLVAANDYLLVASQASAKSKKLMLAASAAAAAAADDKDDDDDDGGDSSNAMAHHQDHEQLVAKELVQFGAEHLLGAYKGTSMFAAVQSLLREYTESL